MRALCWRSDEPSTQVASPAMMKGGVRGDGETKPGLKMSGECQRCISYKADESAGILISQYTRREHAIASCALTRVSQWRPRCQRCRSGPMGCVRKDACVGARVRAFFGTASPEAVLKSLALNTESTHDHKPQTTMPIYQRRDPFDTSTAETLSTRVM